MSENSGYAAFNTPTDVTQQALSSQQQVQNQQAANQAAQTSTVPPSDLGGTFSDIAIDMTAGNITKKPASSDEIINLTEPTPDTNIFNEAGEAITGFFEGVGEFLGGFNI